jgi:hypothetical protein
MSKRRYLFSHLANDHGIVDQFMPNGMQSRPPLSTVEKVSTVNKRKKLPDVDDEDQPIRQSTRTYNCQLCCATRKVYKYLVNHYCTVHYKDDLLSIYNIEASNACPCCDLKYVRQDALFFHLVTVHGVLREKIPKKEECMTNVTKRFGQNEAAVSAKWFKCHSCNQTRKSYKMILTHFALVHFRKTLVERFDINVDNLKCSFCAIKMTGVTSLILHLVCNHEALKDFIPSKESLLAEVPNNSEEPGESSKDNLYKCHICEKNCSTYKKILAHYGNVHYKQKLVSI